MITIHCIEKMVHVWTENGMIDQSVSVHGEFALYTCERMTEVHMFLLAFFGNYSIDDDYSLIAASRIENSDVATQNSGHIEYICDYTIVLRVTNDACLKQLANLNNQR